MLGPIGVITGVQILIALLQSGALDKLFSVFEKGTDALTKYNKELFKLTEAVRANQAVSLSYVKILRNVNTSEEERSKVIKELIRLTPTLKEEDFKYKENLGEVVLQIQSYTLAQANRLEADKLVEKNSALLAKERKD